MGGVHVLEEVFGAGAGQEMKLKTGNDVTRMGSVERRSLLTGH